MNVGVRRKEKKKGQNLQGSNLHIRHLLRYQSACEINTLQNRLIKSFITYY